MTNKSNTCKFEWLDVLVHISPLFTKKPDVRYMCVHVDVNHSVPLIDKIYFHEQQYKSNILF